MPMLVLLSPLILLLAVIWFVAAVVLHLATVLLWVPRGRKVVFVYSDSPVWKDYIERNILPRLPETAAILNWSERKHWGSFNLAVWLFRFYAGGREYNPLGLIIHPLWGPKVFRFWRAFRDFKHGNIDALQRQEAAFLEEVGTA